MSNPFSPRRPQRSWFLQVAEYASVAASAVGAVASALSQQVVYAAAPLSLSLCLNLVNRRRFEQQTQHRLNETIAALDQRILERPIPNYADLTQRVSQLQEQVSEIEQYQTEQTTQQTEVRSQLAQLSQQLTALQQRQNELVTLEEQITQLQERLASIEALQLDQGTEPDIDDRNLEATIEPQIPGGSDEETTSLLGELSLNLGIDFGTSFTKVCFRDMVTDRSEIVTFTDDVTHIEEALLPTKIGILADGTLVTGLTASEWQQREHQVQSTVEFIKMRLAAFDLPQGAGSWQLERLPQVSEAETVENLCAYYLSRVITRAQTWIRRNKPELIVNQKIDWSANVGVPVEYYDSPAIKRFQRTLSLAWLLSNEPQTEQMTLENLHTCLKPLRAKLQEATSNCHATPEIAAEVWSLLDSREVDEGFYVLFDIGDGTLDGSSFRYWNDDGEKRVDFYSGKVNPLGVTAFAQQLARELGVTETEVKETICANSINCSDRFQSSTARKNIQRLVAKVVRDGSLTYRDHGFRLVRPGKTTLDILIGGGGGQTSFYQQAITSTYQDFQHGNSGIPEYSVRSLPLPKDLETNGISRSEFYRFAVAYGLSIPDGEQPRIRFPSDMEKIKLMLRREEDPLGRPPRYEDMRGS